MKAGTIPVPTEADMEVDAYMVLMRAEDLAKSGYESSCIDFFTPKIVRAICRRLVEAESRLVAMRNMVRDFSNNEKHLRGLADIEAKDKAIQQKNIETWLYTKANAA